MSIPDDSIYTHIYTYCFFFFFLLLRILYAARRLISDYNTWLDRGNTFTSSFYLFSLLLWRSLVCLLIETWWIYIWKTTRNSENFFFQGGQIFQKWKFIFFFRGWRCRPFFLAGAIFFFDVNVIFVVAEFRIYSKSFYFDVALIFRTVIRSNDPE